MILKKCDNGTGEGCSKWDGVDIEGLLQNEERLEEVVWNGLKMWHLIFLSIAGVLSVIILLCCCVKFRIPRTKQEIEADYIRRKILRKFRKRLKAIQNQELDEMDLKKALDKIRAEFKSDTESLAQSEAGFSAATISSTGLPGQGVQGSTYRRASQIQIDISLEDLRAHSLGLRARIALALSRLFGRSRVSQSDKVALTVAADGQGQLTVPETSSKKADKKAEAKKKEEGKASKAKDTEVKGQVKTTKVKGQPKPAEVKGQQQQPKPADAKPADVKGQDKKQKEKEEKERKKLEKEKEKAEKARLKIENEKLKKSKEKEKKDKNKEKDNEQSGGSKDKLLEDNPKDKEKSKEKEKPKEKEKSKDKKDKDKKKDEKK